VLDTTLALAFPEKPSTRLKRLRGTLPLVAQVRRPVPDLVVPLGDAAGKSFTHEEITFLFKTVSYGPGGTLVELSVRLNLDRVRLPGTHQATVAASRLLTVVNHQVEFADDQGRMVAHAASGGTSPNGTGQFFLATNTSGTKLKATSFRYFGMVRVPTDASFEFRDLPLP
jgi:hypothetical protein